MTRGRTGLPLCALRTAVPDRGWRKARSATAETPLRAGVSVAYVRAVLALCSAELGIETAAAQAGRMRAGEWIQRWTAYAEKTGWPVADIGHTAAQH
jgi:hypothetical protein